MTFFKVVALLAILIKFLGELLIFITKELCSTKGGEYYEAEIIKIGSITPSMKVRPVLDSGIFTYTSRLNELKTFLNLRSIHFYDKQRNSITAVF